MEFSFGSFLIHLFQGLGAVGIGLILLRSSYLYKKPHLNPWSKSWIAFGVYLLIGTINYLNPGDLGFDHPLQISYSVVTIIAAYLHLYWLVEGTIVLNNGRMKIDKIRNMVFIIIVLASILLTFAYVGDEQGAINRLLLRVGLKNLIASICFVSSSFFIILNKRIIKCIAVWVVFSSFLIYGFLQLFYFTSFYLMYLGNYSLVSIIDYPNALDLFLELFMGVGIIFWLLEEERRELVKTNLELDTLVYSTSHDLRAPLSSILGLIDLSGSEKNTSKTTEYLSLMKKSVMKQDQLIRDIMAYYQSNKGEVIRENVNIESLLSEIIEELKFIPEAKQIKFIFEHTSNGQIVSDPRKLKIILSNLLSNAIKYHNLGRDNPYIKIELSRKRRKIYVRVEDNGIGIENDQKDKIFNMFYRASGNSDGTGLGLFIVKEALDTLGGKISLVSQINRGSIFTIELNAKFVQ